MYFCKGKKMNIYCDKISDSMIKIIEATFIELKNDPLVYSFYFDFFKKRVFAYYKKDIYERKISKEIITFAIKKYIQKKIEINEIIPRYNIQCFSCRKKIYGTVPSLNSIPSIIICKYCNTKVNIKEDYVYYDLRYVFKNKKEPLLVEKKII